VKKNTQVKKELNAVNADIKKEQRLAHLEFEKKEVRKKLDISNIDAADLETMMKFLGVHPGEGDKTLNRRLTQSQRKTTSKK
jgi:hypothetical protein